MQNLKPALILTLIVSVLALTACKGSIKYTETNLTAADAALSAPCNRPVKLPARALTQADVESYWARDRISLVRCAGEKAELVRYYDDLFKRIAKKDRG